MDTGKSQMNKDIERQLEIFEEMKRSNESLIEMFERDVRERVEG